MSQRGFVIIVATVACALCWAAIGRVAVHQAQAIAAKPVDFHIVLVKASP